MISIVKDYITQNKRLVLDVFIISNFAFLSLDILYAHAINGFSHWCEWIPLYFSIFAAVVLFTDHYILKRDKSWVNPFISICSIFIGALGLGLHLESQFFQDFNLKIRENEKVAFVGHSGCGKTTLVKLLNRFYDVNSGEILIDGKNINDFKQDSIRSETGIVPQECVLFDDTIYNNIRFADPGASRKEVLSAIRFAQLDEIIANFPDKEKTIVGERGVKLSGGEKQRVSIARAILADKKILLLDEATSALDSETEYEIQKDLQKLLRGRTSIIIAHRLSTIMNADRIVVLKRGKIIQMGKHNDLIREDGEYKKLWNLQKGGYIK